MLRQVYVEDPGESTFLIGEIISKNEFNKQNQKLLEEGRAPARSKPILQGITKASEYGFLHFGSIFPKTTKVLTDAALSREA